MTEELKSKTEEELKEMMRNSIDNQYVSSSDYHKAKQELEFRHIQKQEDEKNEIVKLSPQIYGVGINLKLLWKKIKLSNKIKTACFIILIMFGALMFVYGGFDDSPGGQLLGLLAVVIGIICIIRSRKKHPIDKKTN